MNNRIKSIKARAKIKRLQLKKDEPFQKLIKKCLWHYELSGNSTWLEISEKVLEMKESE